LISNLLSTALYVFWLYVIMLILHIKVFSFQAKCFFLSYFAFLRKGKRFISRHAVGVCPTSYALKQLNDFRETWHEHYAIWCYPSNLLFVLLLSFVSK
jgi:hypothetical protein